MEKDEYAKNGCNINRLDIGAEGTFNTLTNGIDHSNINNNQNLNFMSKVSIYLNFQGNAEEAFNLYKSVFGGEFGNLQRMKDIPNAPEMPDEAVNLFAASVDFLIRSGAVPPTLLRILREEQSRKPTNASESACDRQTLAWLPPSTPATIVRGKGVEIYKPEDDPPF